MHDIYNDMHEFNGKLLKELLYSNWDEVKSDLIDFLNSLHSFKKVCKVGECPEGGSFFMKDLVEDECSILTKEQFFEFLGRVIFELYIEEMIMFNCFAMEKIFSVSKYFKNK